MAVPIPAAPPTLGVPVATTHPPLLKVSLAFLDALSNPYFWAYTAAAAGLLAAAWGVLFWLQRRGQRLGEWRRLFWSWVLVAGVITAAILVGQPAFALIVALLALFACKEFARATGLYEDWMVTGFLYLCILGVNLVALSLPYDVFMATPIYVVAALCFLPILRQRSEGMLQHVALSVMAFVYFGFFLGHLSLLPGDPNHPEPCGYLLFLLYGTATTELAGWLVNRWLGRHPLAAHISPEVTWEGAAGALGWALLWSFLVGLTLPGFHWAAMLMAAFIFGVMGPLGDLVLRYILGDLKGPVEGTPFDPYLALGHLNRLIFVAPLFFRLVHYLFRAPPAG